jgi:hypothetical protein
MTPAGTDQTLTCRLCGAPAERRFVVGDLNRELGPGRFTYVRCHSCHVTSMLTVPDDLGRYYATDGYGRAEEELTPESARREAAKLEMVRRFTGLGRLVEIGPGPGLFTRVARDSGFQTTAIEMDEHYSDYLREKLGVNAIHSSAPAEALQTLPPSRAVVMWHVIEHLPDPWEVLRRSVANLEPGGVLALSTPNPDSLQYRLLKQRWVHVDCPRHLQLIPASTLDEKLGELGMSRVHITTSDPTGRALSRGGWEVAVRRRPARRPVSLNSMRLAHGISLALGPIEGLDLLGAAYTALYTRAHGLGEGA